MPLSKSRRSSNGPKKKKDEHQGYSVRRWPTSKGRRSLDSVVALLTIASQSGRISMTVPLAGNFVLISAKCRRSVYAIDASQMSRRETAIPLNLARVAHAESRVPSLTSFSAFIVPCSACLWFLRNLGSVPLREGYRFVFGFLIPFLWFFFAWLCWDEFLDLAIATVSRRRGLWWRQWHKHSDGI